VAHRAGGLRVPTATRPDPQTLPVEEPDFPWIVVPILSLGFVLFFAGLALLGVESGAWQALLAGAGVGLMAGGFALLARRFL